MGSSAIVIHGINDVATLEAIACREALSLADDLMIQNFVVASDSKQVVNDITRGSNGAYGSIITEIKRRALPFNYIFTFEGRAANNDADRLAKYSHSLDRGDMIG